ncbi:MAG: PAS domain-containing protein, partial [Syntrophobacterales bacterium]
MKKVKSQPVEAEEPLLHAEEQQKAKVPETGNTRTDDETRKLVHELEVHLFELETQNEELRQSHDELELSRNTYAELYEFAPIGYFSFDVQGMILEVNHTGAKLLRKSRPQLTNKPFVNYIADTDEREIFFRHLNSVLQSQGIQRCEISLKGKDGTIIHGQLQSVKVGKIKSKDDIIFSSIVDNTVAKHLDKEIKDAREYAENIVETVREPLVVLSSDLKILTANLSFYETFKVTPEETIDHFIYDVGNRQWDIRQLRVLVEEILPQDTVINDYEVEHDFPNIGRKTILLNAREIFREEIGSRIILLAMEDITDRKLAEERISEVIRQQQAILDNIPNIAWLKDREGRYVAANDPFSRAFGVPPEDLVGKNDFDIFPHELAIKYEKEFKEV